MAEIISLKAVRKAKARAEKQQLAAENRTIYGATKAEKQRLKAEKAKADATLDGHRKGPGPAD